MKMKNKRMLYIVLLGLLIGAVLFIYTNLNGNPLSRFYSTKVLEDYLEEKYPEKEFRIDETHYNFKIAGYDFSVIEIGAAGKGGDGVLEHDFTVGGFWKPEVVVDGVYVSNLDERMIAKLGKEASEEISHLLAEGGVKNVKSVDVMLEVQKGQYPADQVWNKGMTFDSSYGIHILLDATECTKDDIYTDVNTIQSLLDDGGYGYGYASINGNIFDGQNQKDEMGYVRYYTSIEKGTALQIDDIEEMEH